VLAAGDFVGDEQGEEVGVGDAAVDGLAVAGFEGVEDAGQAQLLELWGEGWNRVHGCSGQWMRWVPRVNRPPVV
jgi:hypothetical protein